MSCWGLVFRKNTTNLSKKTLINVGQTISFFQYLYFVRDHQHQFASFIGSYSMFKSGRSVEVITFLQYCFLYKATSLYHKNFFAAGMIVIRIPGPGLKFQQYAWWSLLLLIVTKDFYIYTSRINTPLRLTGPNLFRLSLL